MSVRTSTKEAHIPDKLPKWLQAGWLPRLPCPWTLLDRFGRLYTTNSQAYVVALSHLIGVASLSVISSSILPAYIVKYIACIYCQVYCQQQHVSWLPNAFSSSKSCLQAESTDLVGMSHFLTWSTSSSLRSSNLNDLNSLLMSYMYQTSRDKDSGTKVLPYIIMVDSNHRWNFAAHELCLQQGRGPSDLKTSLSPFTLGSFEGTSWHMCNVRTHSTWMLLKDRDVLSVLETIQV